MYKKDLALNILQSLICHKFAASSSAGSGWYWPPCEQKENGVYVF